jgi:hypothetical protein
MYYNGSSWVTLGNPGFSADEADYISLAIYTNGTPYVAFRDCSTLYSNVTVMYYNGTSWLTLGPQFTNSTGSACFTSLTLDSNGVPYVAYGQGLSGVGNGGGYEVIRYNGSSWVSLFQGLGGPAGQPSLVFNNGTLYLACSDGGSSNQAIVMYYNGSHWYPLGNPDFSAGGTTGVSIAFNGNTPYVAYSDYVANSNATVMYYNGTSWVSLGKPGFSLNAADMPTIACNAGVIYVAIGGYGYGETLMYYSNNQWNTLGSPYFSGQSTKLMPLVFNGGSPYVALGGGGKATVMVYKGNSTN